MRKVRHSISSVDSGWQDVVGGGQKEGNRYGTLQGRERFMMLGRQLAHLNFGMPRVRSHGVPFVAAGDDHRGRDDKRSLARQGKKEPR